MRIKTTMFAAPIVGLLFGALMLPVGAQTCTYTRTITSYDEPVVIDRVVEDPVIVEHPMPMTFDQPVTIERPVVIDNTVPRPLVIKERPHHAFHLGLFPLGDLDLF